MKYIRIPQLLLLAFALSACSDKGETQGQTVNQTQTTPDTAPPADTTSTAAAAPSSDLYVTAMQAHFDEKGRGLTCESVQMPLTSNPYQIEQSDAERKPEIMNDYKEMEAADYVTIAEGSKPSDMFANVTDKTFDVVPTQKYIDVFGEPNTYKKKVCYKRKEVISVTELGEFVESPDMPSYQEGVVTYRQILNTQNPMLREPEVLGWLDIPSRIDPEREYYETFMFYLDEAGKPAVLGSTVPF